MDAFHSSKLVFGHRFMVIKKLIFIQMRKKQRQLKPKKLYTRFVWGGGHNVGFAGFTISN